MPRLAIASTSRQQGAASQCWPRRLSSLSRIGAALLCAAGVLAVRPAAAAPAPGPTDYSNDPLNPSVVNINSLGQYIFDGHVGGTTSGGVCTPTAGWSCVDYITINVPQGLAITGINLSNYDSTDDRAFVGIQAGSQFTASLTTGAGMLGYNHFGWRGLCSANYGALRPSTASANNNCIDASNTTPVTTAASTNLLTNTYVNNPPTNPGPSSPTFTTPLGAGSYTFNIQQVSGDSLYTFTVQTGPAPAPGPLPVLGAGAAFGWSRRLRRRLGTSQPSA